MEENKQSSLTHPFLTVIVNVFNGEKYIRRALNSILDQTFKPDEVIIWDNCSTDKTSDIVKNEFNFYKYIKSPSKTSLGMARESARKIIKNEWIAYLDCDDYWFPNKLEEQIKHISSDVGIIYSGVEERNDFGNLLSVSYPLYESGYMLRQQLKRFDINMVTPLINNSIVNKYNLGFDLEMIASEEQDLFLKICCIAPVITLPVIHAVSTIRNDSLTNQSIKYWAIERNKTLDALKDLLLSNVYDDDIANARVQAEYYKARYLYSIHNYSKSRSIMKSISNKRIIYNLLYIISFFPFLWNIIHKRSIKVILTNIFRING